MERDVGIEGYLTSTAGVGGILKETADDFAVEEVSSPPPTVADGRVAIAALRLRNWETNRLVRQLARTLHISRRRIGFAGTKDKRAITTQLFSFDDVRPEALKALRLKDLEVVDVFRSDRGLEIGDLRGNRFNIVVRRLALPPEEAATAVTETARQLRVFGGFPNFFGVQRFGSVRPITHVVGRHIVRGEFREAVEAYAANPIEGEDPESYGFEKALLNHLAAHPGDSVGALRQLPFNLLLMFVHGYQSYLYNRMLAERLRRGLPIHEPVAGDLVLPSDRFGLPDRDRLVDVTCDNLDRVAERCREGKAWVAGLLYGSESEFAGGEPGQIEKQVVGSEGLRREDFIIPELPRLSSKGTRREILAPFFDLDAAVVGDGLRVDVELTRGAYATCLLREFMKAA